MRKTLFLATIFLVFANYNLFAQLDILGQYKMRTEFLNGYSSPLYAHEKPGFYIHQRARIGARYTIPKLDFTLVAQDVRTWGEMPNSTIDKNGLFSIFEANINLKFNPKWSVKIGRQPISYDNQRILGELDWLMQARRHDAVVVHFQDSTWTVDFGGAYNQAKASNVNLFYTVNNYQNMEFLWVNKRWTKAKLSFLALNNGIEQLVEVDSIQKSRINYSQTVGLHFEYSPKKWGLFAYQYFQMGRDELNTLMFAFNLSLTAVYKPTKNWELVLGGEALSGNSMEGIVADRNYAFNPIYGTNHGFNGAMDYFYSGNHLNNVGLLDFYLKLNYSYKKIGFSLANHGFFSAASVGDYSGFSILFLRKSPYLGFELDFTFNYQFIDEVAIKAGFSQFIGTSSLRLVKGNKIQLNNNWAYIMITAHPFKNLKLIK